MLGRRGVYVKRLESVHTFGGWDMYIAGLEACMYGLAVFLGRLVSVSMAWKCMLGSCLEVCHERLGNGAWLCILGGVGVYFECAVRSLACTYVTGGCENVTEEANLSWEVCGCTLEGLEVHLEMDIPGKARTCTLRDW